MLRISSSEYPPHGNSSINSSFRRAFHQRWPNELFTAGASCTPSPKPFPMGRFCRRVIVPEGAAFDSVWDVVGSDLGSRPSKTGLAARNRLARRSGPTEAASCDSLPLSRSRDSFLPGEQCSGRAYKRLLCLTLLQRPSKRIKKLASWTRTIRS